METVISLPPALLHPDFRRLWVSMLCSGLAMQMAQVAIGWQVYSINHSAFDLGLIGLFEFVPVLLLALPAGSLADRLPRLPVVIVWGFADAIVTALLLVVTIHGAHELWPFLVLAAFTGTLAALGNPSGRSLVPEIIPGELLSGALALRSIASQVATIGGPAVGGLLFAIKPESVYVVGIVLLIISSVILLRNERPEAVRRSERRAAAPRVAARRHPLHPRNAGHPRRDHARPLRRAVRRRRSRCCRSSPSRSSTPARSASACCEPWSRSARSSPGSASPASRCAVTPAARCSSSSACSARAWSCSGSHAGSGCPHSHSRSAGSSTCTR